MEDLPEQALIVTNPELDPDQFQFQAWADRRPFFSPLEVAKAFFGQSAAWVRERERSGMFMLGGKFVGGTRTEAGIRSYDLRHIELMAHALGEHTVIDGRQVNAILQVCLAVSQLYALNATLAEQARMKEDSDG